MIEISNIKLYLDKLDGTPQDERAQLHAAVLRRLHVAPDEVTGVELRRRSIDARKKSAVHLTCTARVSLRGGQAAEERLLARLARRRDDRGVRQVVVSTPRLPSPIRGSYESRPVVVGAGCAGLFCALALANAGLEPLLVERGDDAARREQAVARFSETGELDVESNIQFGAGGAGTFSDGKLTTGTKSPLHRLVLDTFIEAGAAESIAWDAKPHIGTDVLVTVVQNLREKILHYGGEVRFGHRMTGLSTQDGRITALTVHSPEGEYTLPAQQVILAIGHSARDTFEMLHAQSVPMEPKPFSMGVRIEHRQSDINTAQYGAAAEHLPAADYSLSCHLPDGSSAYTFCMCPGGEVFAAASEQGGVCTNGMSNSRRDGENANAAVLVTLHPEDFPDKSTLGGMYWQRSIEQRAYVCGGGNYHAPAQRVGDFLAGRASTASGRVQPTYRPGVTWCDLHDVLPQRITATLAQALPVFGQKLRGFDDPDAVLTAPETRSSSPVRIVRGPDRCSTGVQGLYPCGEGAGYAGGITSAAVDGLRCAECVIKALQNEA